MVVVQGVVEPLPGSVGAPMPISAGRYVRPKDAIAEPVR